MHHRIVNGCADTGGISFIMKEGRDGMVFANQLLGIRIQCSSAHAGLYSLTQLLQHFIKKRA